MLKYKLSTLAEEDLEDIYKDGVYKFGKNQAITYLEEINNMILFLSENPETGRKRDDIKKNLVCYSYKSHIVFYRIFKTRIRIVRILYGGKDLVKFLK